MLISDRFVLFSDQGEALADFMKVTMRIVDPPRGDRGPLYRGPGPRIYKIIAGRHGYSCSCGESVNLRDVPEVDWPRSCCGPGSRLKIHAHGRRNYSRRIWTSRANLFRLIDSDSVDCTSIRSSTRRFPKAVLWMLSAAQFLAIGWST